LTGFCCSHPPLRTKIPTQANEAWVGHPGRNAILKAALVEFAQEGLAGARMDAIAEAAAEGGVGG